MKIVVPVLLVLFLAILCPAQSYVTPVKPLSDAYIRQQIVGTWFLEEPVKPAGTHKLVMTMSADGTSVSKTSLILPKQTNEWNYAGKWEIKSGICSTTLTKSSAKNGKSDKVGTVESCKVLAVDANDLVEQAGQQIIKLKRKK